MFQEAEASRFASRAHTALPAALGRLRRARGQNVTPPNFHEIYELGGPFRQGHPSKARRTALAISSLTMGFITNSLIPISLA